MVLGLGGWPMDKVTMPKEEKVTLKCMECGKVFKRKNPTVNTKCPSCNGYDLEPK